MAVNIQRYSLKLVKESGGRYKLEDKVIRQPDDAYKIFTEIMELNRKTEEVFAMITLDSKCKLIGTFEVSTGTINSGIVTPREVFKRAIVHNSASLILAHNHPSGDPEPSREDIEVTNKLMETGKIVGINVLDHLVIGDGRYLSLKADDYLD